MIEFLQYPRVLETIGLMTIIFLVALGGLAKARLITINGKRMPHKCPDPDCHDSVVKTAQVVRDLRAGQQEIKQDVKSLNHTVAVIETQLGLLIERIGPRQNA